MVHVRAVLVFGAVVLAGSLVLMARRNDLALHAAPSTAITANDAGSTGGSGSAPVIDVATYLAQYFGPRWEEVRSRAEPPQELLAAKMDPAAIPDWKEVEPDILADLEASCNNVEDQVRQALKWDEGSPSTEELDLSSAALNPTHKKLDPVDAQRIRADLQQFDADIRSLATEQARYKREALLLAFSRGEYEKAPLIKLMPSRLVRGKVCCLKILAADNWNVTVGFVEGDSADFDSARLMLSEMRRARTERARALIAGRT